MINWIKKLFCKHRYTARVVNEGGILVCQVCRKYLEKEIKVAPGPIPPPRPPFGSEVG